MALHSDDSVSSFSVTSREQRAAFAFHREHLGDFLLPIDRRRFAELADQRRLHALGRDGLIVGLCYVRPDANGRDPNAGWEYGGLYLDPAVRGHGHAVALSTDALRCALREALRPVRAYVHHEHRGTIRPLLDRLGFVSTGLSISLGPEEAPGYLRRDQAGVARADVLELTGEAVDRIVTPTVSAPSGAGRRD